MKKKVAIFKNTLQKMLNKEKLQKHHNKLNQIRSSPRENNSISGKYKQHLRKSLKKEYLKFVRNMEINRENESLTFRMKEVQKRARKDIGQRNSKSLNMFEKLEKKRIIDEENYGILNRLISVKPCVETVAKLKKSWSFQENLSANISKKNKYQLPPLPSPYDIVNSRAMSYNPIALSLSFQK